MFTARTFLAGALGVALFAVALPLLARAQGFRYGATTSIKWTGTTGDIVAGLADLGGGLDEVSQTVSILGDKMRIDRGGTSTIYDLEAGRIVTLTEEGTACSFVTFEQLRRQGEAAKGPTKAAPAGGAATGEESYDLSEVTLDFSVQTGPGTEEISGYLAYLVTFTIVTEAVGEDRRLTQVEGTIILVSDVYQALNVAGYDVAQGFQQRLAAERGTISFGDKRGLEKLQDALEQDSRMQAAMEMALDEQINLDGVPVRTVTYFVLVPASLTYNPLLVRPEKETSKKKVGRFLKKALRKKKKVVDEGPQQRTLFFVTTTMSDFYHGPLHPVLFETPAPCQEAQ